MTQDDYRTGLRLFLKDHEDLNRLLNFKQESGDDHLNLYIQMALGNLNSIPPVVMTWGFDNFPMPSLLLHQAVIEALVSCSIVQARNMLSYNNGGISIQVADGNRYLNLLNALYQQAGNEVNQFRQYKIAINCENAYGGMNSPYLYIAGYPYLNRPFDGLGGYK